MDTQYIQIFLGTESDDSIRSVIEFLRRECYIAYDLQCYRKLSLKGSVFEKRLFEWRRLCFLRINLRHKTVEIELNALDAKRITIKEFMENKIFLRSQINSGMIIHLDAANLLVCDSDVDGELICVNESIHKCTPLNHLLNEDLSVTAHYQSKLKEITYKGQVMYRPTIKLTLQQIADKFGYDVDQICIINDKS